MPTCHICGSHADHPKHQPRERMFGWDTTFDYFQCESCGCLQIERTPEDLARYYPDDYYSLGAPPSKRPGWLQREINWLRLRYRLKRRGAWIEMLTWRSGPLARAIQRQIDYLKYCPQLHRRSRILDVGCGEHSDWLAALAQSGFRDLTGIDPYLKQTTERDGVRYLSTTIDALPGPFDLISLHHSLEHIPDQHAILQALHDRLAPDGVCLIRIPLVDSAVWEHYGLDWVELDAPRHLYLHTRASLAHLAHAHGFEIAATMCDSTAFEFAGSEQYRIGIPLMAPESFWAHPEAGLFSTEQLCSFQERAQVANATNHCGRAAFFLHRSAA
jgi:SAM-dependent methyltransferase